MFRALDDVLLLNIQSDPTEVIEIVKSTERVKERFVLGFQFIHAKHPEIGFPILQSIKPIDTSGFIEPSFIEELLRGKNTFSFESTLQLIQFIVKNASRSDSFEMAIHQHMVQYAQNANIQTSNLRDLLQMISAMTDFNIDSLWLTSTLAVMMQKLTEVPVPRETENIQAMNLDSVGIIEFFRNLGKDSRNEETRTFVLKKVYENITKEGDVSPLICLGLAVIPENQIHLAVKYILSGNCHDTYKHQSIIRATKRLIAWQKMTCFKVPLHIWIVRVLSALHDDKAEGTLHEIIYENIELCFLTLLLPAFQIRTFTVVQAMLEVQQSPDILEKLAPRIVNVLKHLEQTNSDISDPLIDVVSEYVGAIQDAEIICKPVTDFLGLRNRHNMNRKRIRTSYRSSNNVRIGLENLGNTCYMNSVIQALFMTKPFCRELLMLDRDDWDTKIAQKIFALLQFSDRRELNLKFAEVQIRPFDFQAGRQHDSTEFMASLLDKLHEADKKFLKTTRDWGDEPIEAEAQGLNDSGIKMDVTEGESGDVGNLAPLEDVPVDNVIDRTTELNQATVVQNIFGGKTSTTCVCSTCNSKSIVIDSFRDLALSFPEKEGNQEDWDDASHVEFSVQELLNFYFTSEQLTEQNQYNCERCKRLCNGSRITELLQSPKNLILTLKHFHYDPRYHTRSKLMIKKMSHNEVIEVKVRTAQDTNISRTVKYQLYAAVVHSGHSLDSGHYYTIAREKDQTWYKFNDSHVTISSLQELHSLKSPDTPYILFYRRVSTACATPSSTSTACSLIASPTVNEDELPQLSQLHGFLQSLIAEENLAYRKELERHNIHQRYKAAGNSSRWNNDDDPPSSCGGNQGLSYNNFIC